MIQSSVFFDVLVSHSLKINFSIFLIWTCIQCVCKYSEETLIVFFLLHKMEKMSWEIIGNSVGEELQTWGISAFTGTRNWENEL